MMIQDKARVNAESAEWLDTLKRTAGERMSTVADDLSINNGKREAARARHPELFRQIMKQCGLDCEATEARQAHMLSPEFQVAIFEQDAVAIYQQLAGVGSTGPGSGLGKPFGMERELPFIAQQIDHDRLLRRLIRASIRAVYALGLDFGMVRLALAPHGRVVIRAVDPFPKLSEPLAERYADVISAYAHSSLSETEQSAVLIGMDTEFLLTTPDGELVHADQFLGRNGIVGYDSAIIERQVYHALAELRPAPSAEPRQLFLHLLRAMRLASQYIDDSSLIWKAGGSPVEGYSLGGHIHMSGVPLTSNLLRVLDNYLTLPLTLIEDATTRRRRPKFGVLGDCRRKPHGGFEYRTLPSWIINPRIAKGVLALAKLIAVDHDKLPHRPLHHLRIQRAYYEGEKGLLRSFLQQWKQDLAILPSYSQCEQYVSPLIEQISLGECWNEQNDIRVFWKLPPYGPAIRAKRNSVEIML